MQRLDPITIGVDLKGQLTFECQCRASHRRQTDKICMNCGKIIMEVGHVLFQEGLRILLEKEKAGQ